MNQNKTQFLLSKFPYDVVKFLLIALILCWSNLLFLSSFYIVFLCLFIGVISNLILEKSDFNARLILTLIITVAFSFVYVRIPRQTEPSDTLNIDLWLFRKLMGNVVANLDLLMYPILLLPICGLIGVCLGSKLRNNYKTSRILAFIFLVAFIINFWVVGFSLNVTNFADIIQVPQPGRYSFDGFVYLKTFHLMKNGHSFYDSFSTALTQRRGGFTITSFFNVRPPLVFYIWQILPPNGFYIALLFAVFSSALFVFSFLTVDGALRDPLVSILTPVIMSYLFVYGLCGNWFTFHEYWAWFFLGIAIWAMNWRLTGIWIIALCACIMIREMFFVVLFILFVVWLFNEIQMTPIPRTFADTFGSIISSHNTIDRNGENPNPDTKAEIPQRELCTKEKTQKAVDMKSLFLVLMIVFIYYFIHYYFVSKHIALSSVGTGGGFSFGYWFQGNPARALAAFQFCSITHFKPLAWGIFTLILYILGGIVIIKHRLICLYLPLILPLIGLAFIFIGLPFTNYWGLLYLPCFAYIIPFCFFYFRNDLSKEKTTLPPLENYLPKQEIAQSRIKQTL